MKKCESAGSFDGRVALVTGGTRGIGFGIAAELAGRGARVCLTARKPDELAAAVKRLGGPDRALGVRGSADDVDHQADAVAQTAARFGPVDVLVNNAGINPQYGPLVQADLAAVRKVFDVNVIGALGWVQAVWRAGMAEHGGAVLNIASVGGLRPGSMIGAYNASQACLLYTSDAAD